jgi:hypothetical protein
VFCPFFFESDKLEYLEERKDEKHGKRVSSAYIGDLDTYERTIAHEFMHVGIFGYRHESELNIVEVMWMRRQNLVQTVVDVWGSLWGDKPKEPIYGESRCRDFAMRGQPNVEVAKNGTSTA